MNKYILGIDQSTSGTKAIIFDKNGDIVARADLPHRQIISEKGYVSHDPEEIYSNVLAVVPEAVKKAGIDKSDITAIGISNQRETAMVWDRETGLPVNHAVVWQCSRAEEICGRLSDKADYIKEHTGLNLSPYFSAGKIAWVLENTENLPKKLCAGTMDSWLIFKLTKGLNFKTDFSNSARTQLFDIHSLKWNEDICSWFGIDVNILPEVCDSNSNFGTTDLNGFFDSPIPIHAVLGDSNGALFGQGCTMPGMVKATYGTGSSIMMNIGSEPRLSSKGLVTSLAWSIDGKAEYVLEGNINYSGAVTKWVVEDMQLLNSSKEAGEVAMAADKNDTTYLVPAFSGLGAPHWITSAKAIICGMTRSTGRAELVKAAEECIAYQITDVVKSMEQDIGRKIDGLRVDGGPTNDSYLMQFQSDILNSQVVVPKNEELSAIGAAYMAGIAFGVYHKDIIGSKQPKRTYSPALSEQERQIRYNGWLDAVNMIK